MAEHVIIHTAELRLKDIERDITKLEQEWDRLDTSGRYNEIRDIETQLNHLNIEKKELENFLTKRDVSTDAR